MAADEKGIFHPNEMPDACTTIWAAAMELTGHHPLYAGDPDTKDLPLFGRYATEERLEDYMRSTVQKNPASTTFDFYCDLRTRLNDGRLRPAVAAYHANGTTLDPFRTLVFKADIRAVFDARMNPRTLVIAAAPDSNSRIPVLASAARPMKSKTGPKPRLRDALTAKLVQDYNGKPDLLASDAIEYLIATYKHKKTTTAAAKAEALNQLRKNSGEKANSGK